jgi:hypothetical protein
MYSVTKGNAISANIFQAEVGVAFFLKVVTGSITQACKAANTKVEGS